MKQARQQGVIGVLGILVYAAIILVVGITMVTTSVVNLRVAGQRIQTTQSLYYAESGAEDALLQLRRDPNYGITPTTLTTAFGTNSSVDTLIEEPVGASGCSNPRQITASSTNKSLVRRIQLTNCVSETEINAQFNFAVQVDQGGVVMSNNSRINGSVYTNGSVQGANGATITGNATVGYGAAPDANPIFDPSTVADTTVGKSSAANQIDVAQSFTAPDSDKVIKLSLKLKKVGSPSNATVRLVADNGNKPATSTLASGTLLTSSVGSNYGFVDVAMSSNPNLASGNRYWIVLDAASNASNYFVWASDNSYAGGSASGSANFSGGSWTALNTDTAFKVWTGGLPTSLNSMVVNGTVRANTITGSTIGGSAYYQSISGSSVAGTSYPGSPDSPSINFPISDSNVADFKQAAADGGTWNGDYNLTNGATATLGPKKINGNLNISNNGIIYMSGPLWVTGTVNFSNNAQIRLAATYGANDSSYIVSDGSMTLSNNTTIQGNGANSFIMLLSESTGGMNVANNGTSAILVTRHGNINLSNNAGAKALVAYGITMANNSTITYTSGLADVNFTGPGARWTPKGWKEVVLDN